MNRQIVCFLVYFNTASYWTVVDCLQLNSKDGRPTEEIAVDMSIVSDSVFVTPPPTGRQKPALITDAAGARFTKCLTIYQKIILSLS